MANKLDRIEKDIQKVKSKIAEYKIGRASCRERVSSPV